MMERYPGFECLEFPRAKALTLKEALAMKPAARVAREPFPADWPADSDAFDPWIEAGVMEAPAKFNP